MLISLFTSIKNFPRTLEFCVKPISLLVFGAQLFIIYHFIYLSIYLFIIYLSIYPYLSTSLKIKSSQMVLWEAEKKNSLRGPIT